jgi:uncharacterized protein YndB with AHSA1/START domain
MGDEVNSRLHAGSLRVDRWIDRPIEEVFAFLADGENDPKFSPPVLEITKTTEGPPDVGTVYTSTVKDAGVKTKREFKLTEFEPPTRICWTEVSKNLDSAREGTYDLAPESARRSNGSGTPDRTSPTSTALSMASLRQRNMLLLAENRRLRDQIAALKAELAITYGQRRVRQ